MKVLAPFAVWLLVAAVGVGAQAWTPGRSYSQVPQGPIAVLDSVEGAVSNDVPLGLYNGISQYSLGGHAQVNLVRPYTGYRFSAQYDSNFWILKSPSVSSGTQNNLLVGAAVAQPMATVPGLGSLSLAAGASYGLMTHFASGSWSGKTSANQFWLDQVFGLETEAGFRFEDSPYVVFVRPRFYFSPEQNNLQKYQVGVLVGLRTLVGPDAWNSTGLRKKVLAVQIFRDGRPVEAAEVVTGDGLRLEARLTPQNAENKLVSWKSSNMQVATVGPDGSVTAVGPGKASVTLTAADGGKKAVLDLTVGTNPDAFLANLDLGYSPGDSERSVTGPLTLRAQDPEGSPVVWTSSAALVASDGSVVRPSFGSGDLDVVLTAVLTKAGRTAKRTFTVRVLEVPQGDEEAVAADAAQVRILYAARDKAESVTQGLGLPASGKAGSRITWTSGAGDVIAPDGTVLRPAFGKGDAAVTLTATVQKGKARQTLVFPVVVKENQQTNAEALKADADGLSPRYAEGETAEAVRSKVGLPAKGSNGSSVQWTSDKPKVVSADGSVLRPLGSDAAVRLTATLTRGEAKLTRTFTLTVKDLAAEKDLADLAIGYQPGDSAVSVTGNLVLPPSGANGSSVRWTSNNTALVAPDGKVVRPLGADKQVLLTASLAKGDQTSSRDYLVTVKDRSAAVDAENLAVGYATGDSAPSVTQAVGLLAQGPNGTAVAWKSSDEKWLTAAGQVTRPLDGDKTVTLTATVTKGDQKAVKTFTLTVTDASVDLDLEALSPVYAPGDGPRSVTADLQFPRAGAHGTTLVWDSLTPALVNASGRVTRPVGKDTEVVLPVTVSKNGVSKKAERTVLVKDDSVGADARALEIGFAPGDNVDFVSASMVLAAAGKNGTKIAWRADRSELLTPAGVLTRPMGGDTTLVLTATVSKNDQSVDRSWTLLIKDGTEAQIAADIAAQLKANKITGITVAETRRGVTIIATDLNFPPDSAKFTPDITRKITVVSDILKWVQSTKTTILVEGHAAAVGSVETQISVSEARAKAVADFFVTKGSVAPDRISASGKGGLVPVGDNNTEEGRIKNRRVEIVIMKVKA